MKKFKSLWGNKKIRILLILVIILFLLVITFIPHGLLSTVKNLIKPEEYGITKELKNYDENTDIYYFLVTITNPDGLQKVENIDTNQVIYCKGRTKLGIDYQVPDNTTYNFKITLSDGQVKNEKMHFERQRIGMETYKKLQDSDVYVNTPNLDGYVKEYTRYLKYNNDTETLQPSYWITDINPIDWYNYKEQKWANIYVENEGVDAYYVWIPRYCYKKDTANSTSGNERMDIKFIDVFNNYKDPDTGVETKWETLKEQGYVVPEAFEWGQFHEISVSGYWISKYELSELASYKIDFNLQGTSKTITVNGMTKNTDKEVAKVTYAVNQKIVKETTELEDYTFTEVIEDDYNTVNVTMLDSEGRIIGSMTKRLELVDANRPDLSGFDPDTTFYVYWDEQGNEHNEIPINKEPPAEWYDYSISKWANIVTRNNGVEAYFVWIPRYQYRLNTTSQRVNAKFVRGDSTNTESGYQIPEAFTWGEKELYGYWMSKYEISEELAEARVSTELAVSDTKIRVKEIKGTLITEAQENGTELSIEYYINGEKMHEGENTKEGYAFENLNNNETYTVNIIVRDKNTNKYLGAKTEKVKTRHINEPRFDGFKEDRTYYVLYDENGNMQIGDKIKTNGSNMPNNWYDYTDSKWANIVVTDGRVENGQIVDATSTAYFVWIPRYQYNLNSTTQRVGIKFIDGNETETDLGYQIPESFTWNDKELYGYWISKYELNE